MWLFVSVPHSAFIAVFSYSHLSNAVPPKLAQNWQKNGTLNLWKAFGSKDFWNPNEKVWYIDISFTLEAGWKNQSIFLEQTQVLLYEQESQNSLWKYSCKKRPPQKPGGCKAREKRNMNNWKQQLPGSQNNQQPLLTPKSLIMCKHSS